MDRESQKASYFPAQNVIVTRSLRVGRCEKIEKSGTDSPFRAGQLRILKRLRGAKKVSVPDFSIFL